MVYVSLFVQRGLNFGTLYPFAGSERIVVQPDGPEAHCRAKPGLFGKARALNRLECPE